jgi:hypothetical protein
MRIKSKYIFLEIILFPKKINKKFVKNIRLKRWTESEELELKKMSTEKRSVRHISKILNKSQQAIRGKMWQMQKKENYNKTGIKYYEYGTEKAE